MCVAEMNKDRIAGKLQLVVGHTRARCEFVRFGVYAHSLTVPQPSTGRVTCPTRPPRGYSCSPKVTGDGTDGFDLVSVTRLYDEHEGRGEGGDDVLAVLVGGGPLVVGMNWVASSGEGDGRRIPAREAKNRFEVGKDKQRNENGQLDAGSRCLAHF